MAFAKEQATPVYQWVGLDRGKRRGGAESAREVGCCVRLADKRRLSRNLQDFFFDRGECHKM